MSAVLGSGSRMKAGAGSGRGLASSSEPRNSAEVFATKFRTTESQDAAPEPESRNLHTMVMDSS